MLTPVCNPCPHVCMLRRLVIHQLASGSVPMAFTPSESPQAPHIAIMSPTSSPPPPRPLRYRLLALLIGAILLAVLILEIISLTAASWLVNEYYISTQVLGVEKIRIGAFRMCVTSSPLYTYHPATTCYPFHSETTGPLEGYSSLCGGYSLRYSIGILESEFAIKILDTMCDGSSRPAVIALQITAVVLSGLAFLVFPGRTLRGVKPRQCKLVLVLCIGALLAAAATQFVWMQPHETRRTTLGLSAHLNIVSMVLLPLATVLMQRLAFSSPSHHIFRPQTLQQSRTDVHTHLRLNHIYPHVT